MTVSSPSTDRLVTDQALAEVVVALAVALDIPSADVWVHHVRMEAVRQGDADVSASGFCPVVIIRGQARSEHAVAHALAGAAGAVSQAFGVPLGDVWVQWVDVVPGRCFAGGDIV